MYFIINNDKKIIFGWSAKCACSHIKRIYWNLDNDNITPTEKKNETEKCKTILSGDVNAPSVGACFHLTAFYSG